MHDVSSILPSLPVFSIHAYCFIPPKDAWQFCEFTWPFLECWVHIMTSCKVFWWPTQPLGNFQGWRLGHHPVGGGISWNPKNPFRRFRRGPRASTSSFCFLWVRQGQQGFTSLECLEVLHHWIRKIGGNPTHLKIITYSCQIGHLPQFSGWK